MRLHAIGVAGRRRRHLLPCLAILVVALATGCGGDPAPADPGPGATSSVPATGGPGTPGLTVTPGEVVIAVADAGNLYFYDAADGHAAGTLDLSGIDGPDARMQAGSLGAVEFDRGAAQYLFDGSFTHLIGTVTPRSDESGTTPATVAVVPMSDPGQAQLVGEVNAPAVPGEFATPQTVGKVRTVALSPDGVPWWVTDDGTTSTVRSGSDGRPHATLSDLDMANSDGRFHGSFEFSTTGTDWALAFETLSGTSYLKEASRKVPSPGFTVAHRTISDYDLSQMLPETAMAIGDGVYSEDGSQICFLGKPSDGSRYLYVIDAQAPPGGAGPRKVADLPADTSAVTTPGDPVFFGQVRTG